MTDIEKLQSEELESLQQNENNEDEINFEELEQLILGGTKVKIPVLIEYPVFNEETGKMEYKKYTAKLKPLTNTEVGNARRSVRKNKNTNFEIELLRRALYTKNDELFPVKIIKAMKIGIVQSLSETLLDVSGVKLDSNEQQEYIDEIMGF